MKLYTKRGDDGSTGLVGGKRVSKDSLRVEAYGHVDETNAMLGVALACCDESMAEALREIQSDLFVIGSELATPPEDQPSPYIGEARVTQLEHWIDRASGEVVELKNFVLPGGSEAAARLHLARTVARRAERAIVTLLEQESVRSTVLIYLNRLSDLLFAFARLANHRANVADIPWTASDR